MIRKIFSTKMDDVNRFIIDCVDAVNGLLKDPFVQRVTVTATIGTSDTQVPHSLGRIPSGWIVSSRNANATVWQSQTSTDKYLTLKASATVAVTLEIF